MKILIRQALIADPQSPFFNSTQDVLLIDGTIADISPFIEVEFDKTVNIAGLCLSPGWVDPFAHFNDPGFEYKETLHSGAEAAARGGFTDVFSLPNTQPVVHHKTAVEYVVAKSAFLSARVHPIGAVSKNAEGKDLAEMYDMRNSGAVAFSDGLKPIQQAGILLKALQYVKTFDGVVIQMPDDTSIGSGGLMHEGVVSTRLGLPGKPVLAEELMVARDIKLARYTGSKIHFTGVSSPKSLAYIQRAKEAGLQVTCSVTPYHLYFCDEDLFQYDTNLKVNPPIRTAEDRELLREAVLSGVVDCIASHHLPQDTDHKIVEFEAAGFGMIGLQTVYPVLQSIFPQMPPHQIAQLLGVRARAIFGLADAIIQVGQEAKLTLFQPQEKYTFQDSQIISKSKNSPFIEKTFHGKVVGTVQQNKLYLNNF